MLKKLETVLCTLLQQSEETAGFCTFDPVRQLDETRTDGPGIVQSINAAFLIALAGSEHPDAERANRFLDDMAASSKWAAIAAFYRGGIELIRRELVTVCEGEPDFADRLRGLAEWVGKRENLLETTATQERVWSVFFPEGTNIRQQEEQRVEALRERRRVQITQLNLSPISDPARQILFTSNVLLTLPSASTRLDELVFSDHLADQLRRACDEPQVFWYDHPIQIGVGPQANEVLYGLRGLQSTLEFERERGTVPADARLTCILSVSVTHKGLQGLAKQYLAEEFARSGGFAGLDVFVFTEEDSRHIVNEILVPAAEHYLKHTDAKDLLSMFGVDGHYGRHYSFLKAIAAFWNVFIDPETKATFKIDLDQVFPQEELVEQTGSSAFEHFTTPLWGARGVGADGRPLDLGMIAGALVNERDITTSLFTPDVRFPSSPPAWDECVFFSTLPQALSTEAEMMTRYTDSSDGEGDALDGETGCIHRIHVTGGTNGILVDSLRRHRPFTPSFIGRAEDQAYIFSALFGPSDRLAYVHKPGLIMRHDKEAFAQESIAAARVGQLIGDYERILYFSAYAGALAGNDKMVKDVADPFTGCFVSMIPTTVVYLRFSLKCASLFHDGNTDQALQFATLGTRRIAEALSFVRGENSKLMKRYERERRGWDIYYDTLSAIETALKDENAFAVALRCRARETIAGCHIGDSS
ncbi:MAG: hypothetical protein U9N87_05125 [Planctomycetota bacterium]|nr:hypothetical protein [Planctomycetota bacterium]